MAATRKTATAEDKTRAAAHAVGLANELERVLKGRVLRIDSERVDELLDPIYTLLDSDETR